MISLNGLYTTLRKSIEILTNIEVYQNTRSSSKVVDAKWLFIKVVYYLFSLKKGNILHLNKPTLNELAFQLGYSNEESITRIKLNYIPKNSITLWQFEVLKYAFTLYINEKIGKSDIIQVVSQAKYEKWVRETIKIIE